MLNAADIKRQNRHRIFELLVDYGRTTKTELAARSGLSIPTVFYIISDLEARGLIEHVNETSEPMDRGRPRQYLRLDGSKRYAVGVRYEGELLVCGVMNLCGRLLAVRVRRVGGRIADVMENSLPECVEELLLSAKVDKRLVAGVGIGVAQFKRPGPQQIETLKARLGLPVVLGDDAHFAVAGEYANHRQQIKNMLFVSLGTTISCGMLVDGHVLTDTNGHIGRMILQDGKTLDEIIGRKTLRETFGMPPDYDRAAARAHTVKHLSIALHNLLLASQIKTIVLGGDVAARLGESAVQDVEAELNRLSGSKITVLRQSCATPAVLGAAFGMFYVQLDDILGK